MNKDNLQITLLPIFVIIMIISIGYGGYLHYKYVQPYRLYKATTNEKWGWALKSSFFTYLPFLLMGLMYPIFNPDSQWWYSLVCGGISLLLFPFIVLGMMVNLWFSQASSRHLNKYIKESKNAGKHFPFPTFLVADKDTKRFFQEGFPEESSEGEEHDKNSS